MAAIVTAVQLVLNLTAPHAITAPAFLGANIDTAALFQGTSPHRLDLTDPGLIELGLAFASAGPAGSTLRVGGSTADDAVFGPAQPPNAVAVDPAYWDQLVAFADRSGFELVWDLNGYGNTLSMRRSDGRGWNSTNAELLLRHVAANNQSLAALQLGNEPGHFSSETPGAPGPAEHGRDFVTLRQLLEEIFPDPSGRPLVQGPDVCFGKYKNCTLGNCTHGGGDKCADLGYFTTLLDAADGAIDEVTVHNYGLDGPAHGPPYVPHQCTLPNLLTPALWERDHLDRPGMLTVLRGWRDAQRTAAPDARIVLSETATTGDGGCVNLSNTFASGFFWIDQLGLTANEGYWKVYRQDLVGFSGINGGSSYALAGPPGWVGSTRGGGEGQAHISMGAEPGPWPTGPLVANPDFYTSILWKRLMGYRVLWSSLGAAAINERSGSPADDIGVRVYGACAADRSGQVVLAYINPASGPAAVALPAVLAAAPRRLWQLGSGAEDGRVDSRTMRLNGELLTNADAVNPGRMPGRADSPAASLLLEPHTYGFAAFAVRAGGAPACQLNKQKKKLDGSAYV